MIGLVNSAVNYTVFWLVLLTLAQPPFLDFIEAMSSVIGWLNVQDVRAIIANVLAWVVAVSGSYVMNSFITFAHESGRKLSWRAYLAFAASGLLGLLADTATLLVATRFFHIMLAKLVAIGAGFVVNFSMSHFVVFRRRPVAADDRPPG